MWSTERKQIWDDSRDTTVKSAPKESKWAGNWAQGGTGTKNGAGEDPKEEAFLGCLRNRMPAWPGQCEGGEDTREAREAAGWDRDKACREGPGKIGLPRTVECKEWRWGSNQLSDLPVMTCHTSPQTDKKPRTSKDMIPSQSKHSGCWLTIYRWQTWGTERLRDLPEVTKLENRRAQTGCKAISLSKQPVRLTLL